MCWKYDFNGSQAMGLALRNGDKRMFGGWIG